MKGNLFEQFKNYLISRHKDDFHKFIPYYETFVQAKDKIQEILKEAENYYLDIIYEEDNTEGYSDGSFQFHFYKKSLNEENAWQSHVGYHYVMDLNFDERYWGYCECSSEMEGYNPLRKCCGDGCDWTAPRITIKKIIGIASHSFNGLERDMWELEKGWRQHAETHEEELRKKRLNYLETQIKELEKEKELLIKK